MTKCTCVITLHYKRLITLYLNMFIILTQIKNWVRATRIQIANLKQMQSHMYTHIKHCWYVLKYMQCMVADSVFHITIATSCALHPSFIIAAILALVWLIYHEIFLALMRVYIIYPLPLEIKKNVKIFFGKGKEPVKETFIFYMHRWLDLTILKTNYVYWNY